MDRPRCDCHGVLMHSAGLNSAGNRRWRCAVAKKERWAKWCRENPERKRHLNARRLVIGGMYLGMIGMSETEMKKRGILNGSSE